MTAWWNATPELLLVVAVLAIPGLLIARSLRFGWWDAAGLSVPIGLGVLAIANEFAMHAGVRWGLPVVVGTALVLEAATLIGVAICRLWGARGGDSLSPSASGVIDGTVWNRKAHVVAALVTLAAALLGAYAAMHGMKSPHALNQTYDGAFHVNSISAVAHRHSASPSVFARLGNSTGGFYPPTFGAVAGLLVIHAGVNAITAANITAVGIVLLWPLGIAMAIRRLARPRTTGYVVAMVGVVTIGLFPALMLRYGSLWPNALSYLALGPGLVLLLRFLNLDQSGSEGRDPHGRLALWPCVVAAALSLLGVVFAHPGVFYLLFYFAMPALIWMGWRWSLARWPADSGERRRGLIGTVVATGVLFVGVIFVSSRIPSIESVRRFYWPPRESFLQAVGHVLLLSSKLSEPNVAMAVLVIVGAVVAWRLPRGRYLIVCYVGVAAMAIASASIQDRVTMAWTGFWYNDSYRLFATLPALALPLIALGADRVGDWLRELPRRFEGKGAASWMLEGRTAAVLPGVVLAVLVVGLQGGFGISGISHTVSMSYANSKAPIVTPGEAAMFRRVARFVGPGETIAGDPFTGEVLAGVISGRTVVYPTFTTGGTPDSVLVARQFNDYQRDPAVCAAVQRLRIVVVVTGHHLKRQDAEQHYKFDGFKHLRRTPGLTIIDSGGGATAFHVAPCNR